MAPTRRGAKSATDFPVDEEAATGAPHRRESLPRKAKEKTMSHTRVTKPRTSTRQGQHEPPTRRVHEAPRPAGTNNHDAVLAQFDSLAALPGPTADPPEDSVLHCEMCGTDDSASSFPSPDDIPLSCRVHTPSMQCMACVLFYTRLAMNQSNLPRCAWCNATWSFTDIIRLVEPKELEQFEARLSNRLIETNPDFRWCAQDTCVSGQFYCIDEIDQDDPRVCCVACEKTNCFRCRLPWHEGQSCHERQEKGPNCDEDHAEDLFSKTLETMRKLVTKKCPTCASATERTQGCNHMICESGTLSAVL